MRAMVNPVFSDLLLSHAAQWRGVVGAIRAGLNTVRARPQRYVLRTGLAYLAAMSPRAR